MITENTFPRAADQAIKMVLNSGDDVDVDDGAFGRFAVDACRYLSDALLDHY